MVNRKHLAYGVVLLMLTGGTTLLSIKFNNSIEMSKARITPNAVNQVYNDPSKKATNNKSNNFEPSAQTAVIHTKVGGWGFLKNDRHETPGITAEQEELVKQQHVMFVGDEHKKEVTLTFDLGYENGYTARILDTLKAHKVKAIFFVTGPWLEGNHELAMRMVKEGHIIGNHTWSHPSLPTITRSEMETDVNKLQDCIEKTTGQNRKIKYLRPPKGEYSEQTLQWTNEMGYTTVLWSVALRDWVPMSGPQEAIDGVKNNLHNGAIILLHAVSKDVTEGLDTIINSIQDQGYKIVRIDKLAPRK